MWKALPGWPAACWCLRWARRRVRDERGLNGPVIASVFVNPAQFNEAKDFEMYPRDLGTDARKAADAGCEVIFAPEVEVMYPGGKDGPEWSRPVDLPECVVDKGMEDEYRPGHFPGVYLVCRRLLELCRPSAAVFGRKDWQQLQLVTAMSAREGLGVEIIGGETVREPDGLALSSRNVHLKPEDREAALGLSRGIRVAQRLGQSGATAAEAEGTGREVMRRVGEPDVQFRPQQVQAHPRQRLPTGQLDHQHIHLAERQPVLLQDLLRRLAVVRDDPNHGVIRRLMHAERADLAHRVPVERLEQLVEFADPVIQEDAELRHTRRGVPLARF